MTLTMKCMKLDYLLLKPYLKSVLLALAVPMLFPFFTGSLFEGLSFAATVMAMTTGYAFSIAEKNSLDRFYGFLPAKKSSLVAGRYLILFVLGFSALLLSVLVQTAILSFFQKNAPSLQEIIGTFVVCALLFCIYTGVQIPGYYRFGSIKGKMFMFVPTVGFLLFYFIVRLITGGTAGFPLSFMENTAVLLICGICVMAAIIAVSVCVSVIIVNKTRS